MRIRRGIGGAFVLRSLFWRSSYEQLLMRLSMDYLIFDRSQKDMTKGHRPCAVVVSSS